jgi:predicted aldo/keto reductase-like oxidoreductase
VLQLIRESNIFGVAPLKDSLNSKSAISISIKDGDHSFDTAVPYNITESNIQLKNLLKLLEVFSAKTPAAEIEPTRL